MIQKMSELNSHGISHIMPNAEHDDLKKTAKNMTGVRLGLDKARELDQNPS